MRKSLHYICIVFTLGVLHLSLAAQPTEKLFLSGTGEDHTVNWEFYCTEGRNSGKWTTIPVPSNWELQGFGKFNYGFSKDADRGKEKGLYKYSFSVPASWKSKTIRIVFEGAMTDTEVKINGQSAGPVHQGAYYRFTYDVTKILHTGAPNLLEVSVAKHSANESVNKAERRGDFWIFGGIFRPVYLEALPVQHIETTAINAKADGAFTARIHVTANQNATIRAQLYTGDGKKWGTAFSAPVKNGLAELHASGLHPALWSPEFPNLYSVEWTLLHNGQPVHSKKEKFGFRTVEVRERDGIYINGTKVKFRGVNRHSFWPASGRTLSARLSEMDVRLMKEMNMNAVRLSHYPADDHFYAACDSLGLFVLDELAGWHGNYDTPTGIPLVRAMIEKNGNHPSVVMWANGNEGGHNLELDPVFDSLDIQKRPVIHPWQIFRGFDTQHYREYNYGIGNYMHGHNIVMPTEFLHGMFDGGHGAGLEDYWEEMWHHPLSAGGFLWDFSDEGVVRTDKNGEIDTDGNHGADGIVGPYREKEGSFFAIKEIWSPIVPEKKDLTTGFNGKLDFENRFFYTNAKQCFFSWKLSKLDVSKKQPDLSGNIVPPSVPPGQKGTLNLSLPANWHTYDVLYLTALDPFKRELFTWSFPIRRPEDEVNSMVMKAGPGAVSISEADSLFHVSAGNVQLSINKNNGMLMGVRNAKGPVNLTNGPVLEEGVNNFHHFTHRYEGKNLVIASAFDMKEAFNVLQWTIYPSGWVRMEVDYFPSAYFTNLVGVNFSFPEQEIRSVQYMGNGPYRVWSNRMKGNRFGIWTKTYNNSATGEPPFLYPEFKGYHSNMYWCRFNTSGQPFTVVAENEDLFVRLFTPKVSDDPYNNLQPTFPSGNISFMQAISGIGTKTQKPETTGPMGMKHVFYDYEKDPARHSRIILYFDFSGK